MDDERFDKLIKTFAVQKVTRSAVLRGLLAATALTGAALAVEETDAKRRKRGKSKKSRVKSQRADQANAGKVTICHFTDSSEHPYNIITVSANSFEAHKQHGDFEYGNCCLDSECTAENTDGVDQCNEPYCKSGTCATRPKTGASCDDEDLCTENDTCEVDKESGRGVCRGTEKDCSKTPGVDQCNEGYCDSADGECKTRPTEGASCDDGDLCTENDTCEVDKESGKGVCQGTPKNCGDFDSQCAVGTCDSESGDCYASPEAQGTPCDDGDACTGPDTCDGAGNCSGPNICPICVPDGDDCDEDGDCCEDLICRSSGACGACSAAGQGGPCGDNHDCCGSGNGNSYCRQNGTCCPANKTDTGGACSGSGQNNANVKCCSGNCVGTQSGTGPNSFTGTCA